MSFDPQDLRVLMRHWTTGVTVVTVDHLGLQHGMTVNSFTSVALEPPVVLVSLGRSTRTHDLVSAAGTFGVTLLSQEQQGLSDRFSRSDSEVEERFNGLRTHSLVTGAPFLSGGLGFLDCRVIATYRFGSNTLFLGEVLAAQLGEQGEPLVYHDRRYRKLQD